MKRFNTISAITVASLCIGAAGLRAADAPDPSWGKAADNHIFAQSVANEIMAKNPDLVVIGLHAIAPGAKDETLIATNLDRIGKKDDDDDVAVATERKTILAPNLKDATRFEVQVPLKTSSGEIIGAIGLVFKYKEGDNEVVLHKKALAIRDAIAKQVSSLADLFKPTN